LLDAKAKNVTAREIFEFRETSREVE